MKVQKSLSTGILRLVTVTAGLLFVAACQPPSGRGNAVSNTPNTNLSNPAGNSNSNNSAASTTPIETKEPERYQAAVNLKLEAVGEQQITQLPAIGAVVARNGVDRRMEFSLPTGEKVVYLDKGGRHYLILPKSKQYAELTKDALGFEARKMLMPEQIVGQVKAVKGVQKVGEETFSGRQVIRYRYGAAADTKTKAGTVETESFVLVDKETGLPLRSETLSQSQSGASAQGYKGLKFVTEMSDIKTEVVPALFEIPEGFQKVDEEKVKTQSKLIFDAAMLLIGQALKQGQPNAVAPQTGN